MTYGISHLVYLLLLAVPPDSRIIRSCGFLNQTSTNYCYQRAGFGGRQVVCSCDKDNCNGAGALNSSMGVMFAAAAASVWTMLSLLKRSLI